MVFFVSANVGMVCYMNTHHRRILKNNFIMSEMSINSVFRRLFAFLVAWMLVF